MTDGEHLDLDVLVGVVHDEVPQRVVWARRVAAGNILIGAVDDEVQELVIRPLRVAAALHRLRAPH